MKQIHKYPGRCQRQNNNKIMAMMILEKKERNGKITNILMKCKFPEIECFL